MSAFGIKRTLLHAGILSAVFLSIVSAMPVDTNRAGWDTCRTSERHLQLFTLNDYFNGGWAVNIDDYRSFGFGLKYDIPLNLRLSLEYYGLTNREGAAQGSGTRTDELFCAVQRTFRYRATYQKLELIPELGIVLAGDLGMQRVQNSWHRLMKIPEVTMQYDVLFLAGAVLGATVSYEFTDTVFDAAEFSLKTAAHALCRTGYDARLEIGESAHLKNNTGDLFFLEFFYRYVEPFAADRTLKRIAEIETGWKWRYTVQCGGLYVSNEFGMTGGFATGSLGLTFLLDTVVRQPFKRENFIFECGLLGGMSGWRAKIKAHPWNDGRFMLMADYLFLSPGDIQYPQFRLDRQQLVLGGEYAVFPVRREFCINPFIGAGVGFHRGMRYSNVLDTILVHHETPVVTGEIGIKISGAVAVKFLPSNVIYGISISDLYSLPLKEYTVSTANGLIDFVSRFNCFPVSLSAAVDF